MEGKEKRKTRKTLNNEQKFIKRNKEKDDLEGKQRLKKMLWKKNGDDEKV